MCKWGGGLPFSKELPQLLLSTQEGKHICSIDQSAVPTTMPSRLSFRSDWATALDANSVLALSISLQRYLEVNSFT